MAVFIQETLYVNERWLREDLQSQLRRLQDIIEDTLFVFFIYHQMINIQERRNSSSRERERERERERDSESEGEGRGDQIMKRASPLLETKVFVRGYLRGAHESVISYTELDGRLTFSLLSQWTLFIRMNIKDSHILEEWSFEWFDLKPKVREDRRYIAYQICI
ncbi:hypothetical protein ACJX0J_010623, partial [Zea mays]